MAVLVPGQVVAARYRLEREIDRGETSQRWSASDEHRKSSVTMELLAGASAGDATARHEFLLRARSARAVRHPCVVSILDVLELDDGSPALVTEDLVGETLAARLEREGRVDLRASSALFQPIVGALSAAHASGLVHGDLNPGAIFLAKMPDSVHLAEPRGGFMRPKILGFGSPWSAPSIYASPERLRSEELSRASDVWSLGVLFFKCLSGKLPSRSTDPSDLLQKIEGKKYRPLAEIAPSIPFDVSAIVARMLSPHREERPALDEIEQALLPYAPTMA